MTGLKRATAKQLVTSGTALHRICPCENEAVGRSNILNHGASAHATVLPALLPPTALTRLALLECANFAKRTHFGPGPYSHEPTCASVRCIPPARATQDANRIQTIEG
ncbi:MAG: hypothetical protein MUQ10_01125, partial [Anaerolineae bacterium]|nr:hypothetical protein [Anaerolineae bacterium]